VIRRNRPPRHFFGAADDAEEAGVVYQRSRYFTSPVAVVADPRGDARVRNGALDTAEGVGFGGSGAVVGGVTSMVAAWLPVGSE